MVLFYRIVCVRFFGDGCWEIMTFFRKMTYFNIHWKVRMWGTDLLKLDKKSKLWSD